MDYLYRDPLQSNYYEIAPNGSLLVVPIIRPLREVIHEREIVAKYFSRNGPIQVLAGVCDLLKAELIFEGKKILLANLKTPISLELQNKIDVYNTVTAKQIINAYKLEQKKKIDKRQSAMGLDGPP